MTQKPLDLQPIKARDKARTQKPRPPLAILDFLIASVDDIPALIAEVERLRISLQDFATIPPGHRMKIAGAQSRARALLGKE